MSRHPKTTRALKLELNRRIAQHLCAIEDLCHAYGLTSLQFFTVICRDPANPDMTLVTSHDDDLAETCRVAQAHTQEVQ